VAVLKEDAELWHLCSSPGYLAAALGELASEPVVGEHPDSKTTDPPKARELDDLATNAHEEDVRLPRPIQVDDLVNTEAGASPLTEAPPEEQQEPPIRPAIILDRVYRNLWKREMFRRPNLTSRFDQWWAGTGRLAMETDGRQPRFLPDMARKMLGSTNGLYWLQSLGVVNRVTADCVFGFATELTKAYFAATYLDQLRQVGDQRTVQRLYDRSLDEFRIKVSSILAVIAQDSRELS